MDLALTLCSACEHLISCCCWFQHESSHRKGQVKSQLAAQTTDVVLVLGFALVIAFVPVVVHAKTKEKTAWSLCLQSNSAVTCNMWYDRC